MVSFTNSWVKFKYEWVVYIIFSENLNANCTTNDSKKEPKKEIVNLYLI